jgi:hypothetical protein
MWSVPEAAVEPQRDPSADLEAVLDDELSRLPQRHRVAIVLCDLEGMTRKEAARHLGCPQGTLAAWLARARTRLARRLTQRGLAVSVGLVAAVLAEVKASASMPAAVLSAATRAMTLVAAGSTPTGLISARVAALADGVAKAMLLAKLKTMTTPLIVIGVLGVLGLMCHSQDTEPQAQAKQALAGRGPRPAAAQEPPRQMPVPIVLGPRRFREGDAIEITQVHATSPNLEPGDSVTVRGRFRLTSADNADLCLFLTQTDGDAPVAVQSSQTIAVKRGHGDFELKTTIRHRGFLHLTFYDATGNPFSGVYFGTAPQMKQIADWSLDYYGAAKGQTTKDAKHARGPAMAAADTDGDGLSDFHEMHKYRTDPSRKDSAGAGTSDGGWQQRREFTYSVRAVLRVMAPYNLAAVHDDYQDVRVRKETKDTVELEVILYPLNSNAEAIQANPSWKKDYAGMKQFLDPGVTTNWDEAMRKDLLAALARDGIDPDRLTDKEVVEQVSRWLLARSQFRNMFCTFYVGFADGKPAVLPGLEEKFARDRGDPKWTTEEQFAHELFGKQMFAHRTHGTCTSTAVYQTTVLRALGIPTRMVLCIPLADSSDPTQIDMIERSLTNHRVRHDAILGTLAGGDSFASHTFCEVFVGGRWRRLNYTRLGQNILDPSCLGLMVHVHTFNDLSEAKLAETWGTRYANGQRDKDFPHSNPYRLLELSDHFGKVAKVPNPPAEKEHRRITISKVYWPEAKDAPAEIRALRWERPAGSGRFFVHGDEWHDNAGDYLQYKLFMRRSDPTFILRAQGQPDLSCQVTMSFFTNASQRLRELEVLIPPADYARMAKGVPYTLHAVNGKNGYEWQVKGGLTLTRATP